MKIGDLYLWTTKYFVTDIARVLEFREGNSVLTNLFIPRDEGELRQVGMDKIYTKRSEQILHSKKPGGRIRNAQRSAIALVLQGTERR
jgi:hypothetical protein